MAIDADRRPNTFDEARLMRMMCTAGERCSCADENMQWRDQTCAVVELHARRAVAAMDKDPMMQPFHVGKNETLLQAWNKLRAECDKRSSNNDKAVFVKVK